MDPKFLLKSFSWTVTSATRPVPSPGLPLLMRRTRMWWVQMSQAHFSLFLFVYLLVFAALPPYTQRRLLAQCSWWASCSVLGTYSWLCVQCSLLALCSELTPSSLLWAHFLFCASLLCAQGSVLRADFSLCSGLSPNSVLGAHFWFCAQGSRQTLYSGLILSFVLTVHS